jgi:dTDP-4-amino-4,6-dideoxygalactose transaminase
MTTPTFETIAEFENRVAEFFGAPYAVAVDSCTHGVELCLRYSKAQAIVVPTRTYLSIAFLANKLNIKLHWSDSKWKDFYSLTHNVIDAAVLWKKNSYISGTMMSLSFQYQKHLSLGRGGMILLDNKEARDELVRMSYDGRERDRPWREQNISSIGYHYYMTPETAQLGLEKLDDAINTTPRQWIVTDWPDISQMEIFHND